METYEYQVNGYPLQISVDNSNVVGGPVADATTTVDINDASEAGTHAASSSSVELTTTAAAAASNSRHHHQVVGEQEHQQHTVFQVIHEQQVDDETGGGGGVRHQVIQEELVLTLQDDVVQAVTAAAAAAAAAGGSAIMQIAPPEVHGEDEEPPPPPVIEFHDQKLQIQPPPPPPLAAQLPPAQIETAVGGEGVELPTKRLSQKPGLSGNAYTKWQKTEPLNPDAAQFIVNHYTIYRNDNPDASHNKAVAETARFLGATVRVVRAVLKEHLGKLPEMKLLRTSNVIKEDTESTAAAPSSGGPQVFYAEMTSSKECARLVDEKVLMALAKSFRCTLAIRETPSGGDKKSASAAAHYYRIYKPAAVKGRKMLSLSYNGFNFKRIPNNEMLLRAGKEEKALPCRVCHKVFKREQALTSHMRSHLSRYCKFCGQEFVTEGNRLASTQVVFHEQRCNPEESSKTKRPITCKTCLKTFSAYTGLQRHKKICSPKCEKCGVVFKTRGTLDSHKCPYDVSARASGGGGGGMASNAVALKLHVARQKAVKEAHVPDSRKASYQDKINALREKMFSPI